MDLLSSEAFVNIVSHAVLDMDENGMTALNMLVEKFSPYLKDEASEILGFHLPLPIFQAES